MIAIVDYKAGNLTSVARALEYLGHRCEITDRPEHIRAADRVILPGVGAAGATMENLNALGLAAVNRGFPHRARKSRSAPAGVPAPVNMRPLRTGSFPWPGLEVPSPRPDRRRLSP